MSLVDYIERNTDRLLSEWIEFARTRRPASRFMDTAALANGSKRLLSAIVADMKSVQLNTHQAAKSRGEQVLGGSVINRIAKEHAHDRLNSGFTIDQLVAEYRALRASVIRCWTSDMGEADRQMLDELVRFNEAMDQSLTEAIRWFNAGVERTRDIFIGVLGHDLREPLSTAISATELQRLAENDSDIRRKANQAAGRSLERMSNMINDLLDFTRTRAGVALPVSAEPTDMDAICREIAEALELSSNSHRIYLDLAGDLTGTWDADRLKQMVSNLISNALKHGSANSPVKVAARAGSDEVVLSIHNEGPPLPLEGQHTLFDPFTHGAANEKKGVPHGESLGLGLYIVKQIVDAHGGSVELQSGAQSGTTFTVRLPRAMP